MALGVSGHPTEATPAGDYGDPVRRVIIDTDAANEIDDQFALAWALAARDVLDIVAIAAAPFCHGTYFAAMAAAVGERADGPQTLFEELALGFGVEGAASMTRDHPPDEGMARSRAEIERVLTAAGAPPIPVWSGSDGFLADADMPVDSEAARGIVAAARASDEPLHVAVLGAPTNVASALLLDPAIADRITVVFVAGYPSSSAHVDDSFNLVQDRLASSRLFAADVDLVYIPGYQVAEVLTVSRPELHAHLDPSDPVGRLLLDLYDDNPLADDPHRPGHRWTVWDLAPIAWLLDPGWSRLHHAAGAELGPDHRWRPRSDAGPGHWEAHRIDARAVYGDLFARLGRRRP